LNEEDNQTRRLAISDFVIRSSFVIRASSFLIVCFCFGFRDIRRPDVDPD
jgi:hypothetical protein